MKTTTISIDLAKNIFQLMGFTFDGKKLTKWDTHTLLTKWDTHTLLVIAMTI
ncbi:MAG: hypothetical protein ACI8SC_003023 [Colwellia sp.]|jgi:hypothetical protein